MEEKGGGGKLKPVAGVLGGGGTPHMCGGDRANQELALSSVVSPGATTVKPLLYCWWYFAFKNQNNIS